ncbi:Bardet-Biedl syndrome 4 protein [Tritrichomonas musculus]|uniref:Bardet-Biedl syndrome 4 protein n=1 Tax=Tritrichomonas musculus TaxID=1915356 RepID=A0ABR2KQQ6_9EUKA
MKKGSKRKESETLNATDFDPENTNIDELLPDLIHNKHIIGVSTVLEAYNQQIHDSTLLLTCVYLARNPGYSTTVAKYLNRLNKDYPAQVASIQAFMLINNCSVNIRDEKCNEALQILDVVRKKDKKNSQILYNEGFIHALLRNKETAFDFLKASLRPQDGKLPYASAILLMIRIMRSNCQTSEALQLATNSYYLLNRYDKNICIEGMYAAAEKGDMDQMDFFFKKLKKHYKKDSTVMEALVKINLMLGKTKNASDCFQTWSEFDKESPEFFFCCSQLCLASQDTSEAIKNLILAIQLDPSNAEYIANLATVFFKTGAKEKAYDHARSAIRADPYSIHAWLALEMVSPDDSEARDALNKAVELRKNVVDLSGLSIILND